MNIVYIVIVALCLLCLSRHNVGVAFQQSHQFDTRIIGGHEVAPHSIPYQAFLNVTGTDNSTWICGGSLITTNYVLTAGRCCYGARSITAVLGAHDLTIKNIYQVTLESTNFTIYPRFTTDVLEFVYSDDIAVVALPKSIKLNQFVTTVPLPNPYETNTFTDKIGRISGWGITDGYNDTSFSTVLLAQETRILSNRECINTYYGLTVTNICVAANETDSPCVGDYGSPLTVDDIQVGIASQGIDHCGSLFDSPYIYTRVGEFVSWIKSVTDYEDEYTTTKIVTTETTPTTTVNGTTANGTTVNGTTVTITTISTISVDSTTDIPSTTTGKADRVYCLESILLSFIVALNIILYV